MFQLLLSASPKTETDQAGLALSRTERTAASISGCRNSEILTIVIVRSAIPQYGIASCCRVRGCSTANVLCCEEPRRRPQKALTQHIRSERPGQAVIGAFIP